MEAKSNSIAQENRQNTEPAVSRAQEVRVRAAAGGRVRLAVPWLVRQHWNADVVDGRLADIAGVRAAHVYPRTGHVVVWRDRDRCQLDELVDALRTPPAPYQGGRVDRSREPHGLSAGRLITGALVLGAAAVARVFLRSALTGRGASGLFGLAAAFIGFPFLRNTGRELTRGRSVGTDALVTAATAVSLVLRQNVVAVAVLTVLNLGELVQALLLRNSRRHAEQQAADQRAWLVCADCEVEVAVSEIETGDVVAVPTRHRVPVDGAVVEGGAVVHQAAATGAWAPVRVDAGDRVLAGTLVRSGSIRIQATAIAAESEVARLLAHARRAREARQPMTTVADGFSRRFVPTAAAAAGLTFLLTGDVRRALSMLLIACPCAVGLSRPTAVAAGVAAAARRRIHVTSERGLEGAALNTALVLGDDFLLAGPRPTGADLLHLHHLGATRIVVLTDTAERARGLDRTAVDVHVADSPEAKAELVRTLQAEGHVVTMAASTPAEALALGCADLGIAAGTAAPVLGPVADLTTPVGDLSEIVAAIELGRRTRRVMRQNYGLSVAINIAGMVSGAAGVIHPVLAAAWHNAGGIAVLANSARSATPNPPPSPEHRKRPVSP